MENQYSVTDLLTLMERLRDPNSGCPWDVKQTFSSIVPSTIEEAYEVADAIEKRHFSHLEEEVGDLLFQVVFYAQLGAEQSLFDFHSIVNRLVDKLVRRHPHVFPGGKLTDVRIKQDFDESTVLHQWESLKTEERKQKGAKSTLADIPLNLPSVSRAQKLQKRAAQVGFDFSSVQLAMDKVREELGEVEQEIVLGGGGSVRQELGAELGDLLFAVVNVCRLAKFDAESLLRATNTKFEQRFNHVENMINASGRTIDQSNLEEMESFWRHAKSLE